MAQTSLRTRLLLTFLLAGLFPVTGSLIGWWRSVEAREDMSKSAAYKLIGQTLLERQIDHLNWVRTVGDFETDDQILRIDVAKDGHACAFGKWYYGEGGRSVTHLDPALATLWRNLEAPHLALHATVEKLEALLAKGGSGRAEARVFYRSATCQHSRELSSLVKELRDRSDGVAKAQDLHGMNAARQFEVMAIASVVVVLIVAPVLGWILASRMDRRLRRVANLLSESGDHTALAAHQVSAASLSLAQGATDQASSMDRTSSSLEQVAAMTERNAQDATQASECARLARTAADAGSLQMQAMTGAMEGIKASSGEIAKVNRTINDIAFQTNLLSLNAAVEAARAGDAGLGFAVVANEVRNLAKRSAQAAQETAGMIEAAIAKAAQGVEISERVGQGLQQIVGRVRQADDLAAAVSKSSKEQSQAIAQVNASVVEVDKVTRANAAAAEESASAAEVLNSQSDALRRALDELTLIIEGVNRPSKGAVSAPGKAGMGGFVNRGGPRSGKAQGQSQGKDVAPAEDVFEMEPT